MSDQDPVDAWLRDAMATEVPELSPAFDARLARRLRPRRLSPAGRLVMAAYVGAALAVSAWALRGVAFEWNLAAAATLLTVTIVATVASAYADRLARAA